jgi:hypothetical protein
MRFISISEITFSTNRKRSPSLGKEHVEQIVCFNELRFRYSFRDAIWVMRLSILDKPDHHLGFPGSNLTLTSFACFSPGVLRP